MAKKKKGHRNKNTNVKRELVFKETGQDYAVVTKVLGNCRFITKASEDQKERLSIIRGAIRRKGGRIGQNDLVLISKRDFQDDKADIIHKYNREEGHQLVNYEEISAQLLRQESVSEITDETNQTDVVFFEFDDI